MYPYL